MEKLNLVNELKSLKRSAIQKTVDRRLKQFAALGRKGEHDWFSELCFCILTANSKARTALAIQQELTPSCFRRKSAGEISACIRRNRHRFHNNKARFIVEARKHRDIKRTVKGIVKDEGIIAARDWLVKEVKGIGYKEASHFLRNVGYTDVAILDRHILNILVDAHKLKRPKTLNRKTYLDIEKKLQRLADSVKMSQAELDLYLWYMKTGEVLK